MAVLRRNRRLLLVAGAIVIAIAACAASPARAAGEGAPTERGSALDFIGKGGPVGIVIIVLSLVGAALVIDAFLNVTDRKLVPPQTVEQMENLATRGKFSDLADLAAREGSMIGRIVARSVSEGRLGLPAVREAMLEQGAKQVTRLHQRVGYIGFIAAIAPMLGLLGTVTGMIGSFNILGASKGTARPDELAVGIAEALITTCEGLIVAVPLMFFHNYFRDRVIRIAQEASGVCERLLRVMSAAMASRAASKASADTASATAPATEGAPK